MRHYLEDVVLAGNIALINDIAAPDMFDEANAAFGGPPGRDGLVAHVKGFRRAFSQLDISIERIIGGEQDVMAWWSFRGNHTGNWLGRQATGATASGTVFSFFTLSESRITRYRLWLHAQLDTPVIFDSSRP